MKISFNKISAKLLIEIKRFPITILFVLALFVLTCCEIERMNENLPISVWIFIAGGIVLTLASALFFEDISNKVLNYSATIGLVILWGIYCFFLPDKSEFTTIIYAKIAILFAIFALCTICLPFLKKNSDAPFWNFSISTIYQLLLSYIFAAILLGGLCLALFSIDRLFNINIHNNGYVYIICGCLILFAPIYFLANIPEGEQKHISEFSVDRIFKILGLYIIMPILGLYTLILYIYLIQIVIKWELPIGWVSTLVSILVVGGLLSISLLYPIRKAENNKAATLFSNYFGLLVLPLLVLMLVGIIRRISDYGITFNRCYILLVNIWFFGICIYLYFSKSEHIKWIFISFTCILAVSSFGPLSAFNLTEKILTSEIEKYFKQAGLLNEDKISLYDANLDRKIAVLGYKDENRLRESVAYLNNNFGTSSLNQFFKEDIGDTNSSAQNKLYLFGIKNKQYEDMVDEVAIEAINTEFSLTGKNNIVDIKPYSNYLHINYSKYSPSKSADFSYTLDSNNQLNVKILKKKTISIRLKESLKEQIKSSDAQKGTIINGENYKFKINTCKGNYFPENDSLSVISLSGELFY